MVLLMDVPSGFPVHYNNSDEEKMWTNRSLLFNASVSWNMSIYSVITRVLMIDSVREHR